ncbi:MAG: hypothetical protein OET44_15440 [Gammaproteobacteria bacterium]|nr:hypothetical protein [Gammaproteobacteria bacterium]
MPAQMLTLITVDVELSPGFHERHPDDLSTNIRSAYYGDRQGRWGLRDQLQTLQRHGLKAVFFVEALSPVVTGLGHLQDVCALIGDYGHEIQLHTHPEWFSVGRDQSASLTKPMWMGDLSAPDQLEAIRAGLGNLEAAGVTNVVAHRAGAFGANRDTLSSCAQAGLRFDSSYNATMLGNPCALNQDAEQTGPRQMEDIWEIPVSCFRQLGDRPRPLQLCAVSAAEMRQALLRLRSNGTPVATIVSHSFELLTRNRERVQPVHVRRFEAMCEFLAKHSEQFVTAGFADLDPSVWQDYDWRASPVRVDAGLTALRYVGQAVGRLYE